MGAAGLISEVEYEGLNKNTIKIARYLKVLTSKQEEDLLSVVDKLNYSEIMDAINTFNVEARNAKIEKLKKK